MSLTIPTTIGGIPLPTDDGRSDQPQPPADQARVTAWALASAVNRTSSAIATHIALATPPLQPQRMVDLRTGVKNGILRFRNLDPTRVQNADAVMIHVYGTEKDRTDCCTNCKKNLGPFTTCVQLVQDGACSNCAYNSGASNCSFKKTVKRSGTPSLTTPRKLKISRAEADFLVMIRGIRPRQLKLLGNALVGVANKLDDVGYDPDQPVQFRDIESDSDA